MNFIYKYTEERSKLINILICILSILGVVFIPSLISIAFSLIIKNEMVLLLISNLLFCLFLYLLFYKDLNREFSIYKKDFKKKKKKGFKTYLLGFFGMIFFNLLIMVFLKNISSNEEQVREMLFSSPVITFICIALTAPLTEEIVFRKSLQPVIKNKWVYCITCGVLFGFAHLLTNILNNNFALADLFYILPYGSLGFAFALMDKDTNTTFTSIVMHAFHNSMTGILLLITYLGGFIK